MDVTPRLARKHSGNPRPIRGPVLLLDVRTGNPGVLDSDLLDQIVKPWSLMHRLKQRRAGGSQLQTKAIIAQSGTYFMAFVEW